MEENDALKEAEAHLGEAEGDLQVARAAELAAEKDLELAQAAERNAETKIDKALREVQEAATHNHHHQILVEIATTSGFYPDGHPDRVPESEVIEIELNKAATALKLTNTANWVASVNKRPINPQLFYEDNGLKNKVVIDWGPPHGGGGETPYA